MEKGRPMYEKEIKKDNKYQFIVDIFKMIGYGISLIILLKLLRIF